MRQSYRKLESGLRIHTFEMDSPVSQYQFLVPFGGDILEYTDPDTGSEIILQPGSAHFFEHMLFVMPPEKEDLSLGWTAGGTGELREGATVLRDNHALRVNAYTSADITNYWFMGIFNNRANLATMMEYVLTPYLPEERFRQEVGTIADEIGRYEGNPNSQHYLQWKRQAYSIHGAQHFVGGTREDIAKITREDVLAIHSTFYRPSNMHLIATGPVDIDEVALTAEGVLERLGKNRYSPPPGFVRQDEPDEVAQPDNFGSPLRRKDVFRSRIFAGWKNLFDPSLSREEMLMQDVALDFARSSFALSGSALQEEIVRKGLDESTLSAETGLFRDRAQLVVSVETAEPEKAAEDILCAARTVSCGIPPDEFEYLRNAMLVGYDLARNDILGLGERFARYAVLTGNPGDQLAAESLLERITADEINARLSGMLEERKFTVAVMAPEE